MPGKAGHTWTPEDVAALKLHYQDRWLSIYEIADIMERSNDSIASKAKRLGLIKRVIGG